jgi:hypothetical protein
VVGIFKGILWMFTGISGFSRGLVGFHADFRRFKRRFAQVVLCFSKINGLIVSEI